MTLIAVILSAVVAVAFAGVMLLNRSLYVSAVCLLVVLLQTGLIFVLRGAPLLGFLQVMVYAGAVMVLVVITIMATGGEPAAGFQRFADFSFPRWLAVLGLAAAAFEIGAVVLGGGSSAAAVPPADPALAEGFSRALFSSYAPATEAVTLLMFLAALAVLPEKEGA
ncbi:MAG: NADH-quinone oxidoreductase subunit J [Elusimicrobia bacterium]|nr:NADH-quinone oxidoreductase subunit J [Elusimicrobiota bacterium]